MTMPIHVDHKIQIVVADGCVYFRPYSKRVHNGDTVEWWCSDQFYLRFKDTSPIDPNDPIIRSTAAEPGRWTSGVLPIDAAPDRYVYEGIVMWANPDRKGVIEPIHLNSPDIIVEL